MGAHGSSSAAPYRGEPDLFGLSYGQPTALLTPRMPAQIWRWWLGLDAPAVPLRSRPLLPHSIWRHIPTAHDPRRRPGDTTVLSAGGKAWEHKPRRPFARRRGGCR
jgi:hypothetical protein